MEQNELPKTLDELCDYIAANSHRIYVRELKDGSWGPHALSALPAPIALKHALGFIKRGVIPISVLAALLAVLPGCFASHEPPEPVAYASSVEVQLFDDGCEPGAERAWFIGAEYDGEALLLGDEVLVDPMGCAFDADAPGACAFWPGGDAVWEHADVELDGPGVRIDITGRIGPQPDANGYCMLFEYSLVGTQ